MNIKDIAQYITAVAAAAGVIGGIVYSTGWVINKAQAEEVAQQKANEVYKELLVVQQKIYEELKEDDEARLHQDIQILALQIEGLESKPARSDYENIQLRILNQQLALKQAELSKMLEAVE